MGGASTRFVVVALICLGVAAGATLGYRDRPRADFAADSASGEPLVAARIIAIHVGGWVARPGVVKVPDGAIVADALTAAGGALTGALVDRINLAAGLRDGDQVIVPGPGSAFEPEGEAGPLSINRADSSSLQDIPGVGPVLADRIVAYREKHGPFGSVEDLLAVPGIGETKLAAMRDHVRVP